MTEQQNARPVPKPDAYVPTAAFWDAAARRVLVLQRCLDTGRFQHPPRPVSVFTGSRNLEWAEVSGRGSIYAVTTLTLRGPETEGRTPLVAATVELDERVRLIVNIVDTPAERLVIGARVELGWDDLADGVLYPVFKVTSGEDNRTNSGDIHAT